LTVVKNKGVRNMRGKLKAQPLAKAFAVWSALFMLVLWVLAKTGIYVSAAEMMAQWHVFFNLTFTGLIAGMIEAAIITYIVLYVFAWIYNGLLASK